MNVKWILSAFAVAMSGRELMVVLVCGIQWRHLISGCGLIPTTFVQSNPRQQSCGGKLKSFQMPYVPTGWDLHRLVHYHHSQTLRSSPPAPSISACFHYKLSAISGSNVNSSSLIGPFSDPVHSISVAAYFPFLSLDQMMLVCEDPVGCISTTSSVLDISIEYASAQGKFYRCI